MRKEKLPAVLVVEDEPFLGKAIQTVLEDEDIEAHVVLSGEEGLKKLETTWIDVCTVDMRLPGMTGNDFIIQAHQIYPHLRFIINTGSVSYSIPGGFREIGIAPEHVFIKPIYDLKELIQSIVEVHSQNSQTGKKKKPHLPSPE